MTSGVFELKRARAAVNQDAEKPRLAASRSGLAVRGHLSSIPPRARRVSGLAFALLGFAMLFVLSPVALGILIGIYTWERGQ
jgi:hypothetical protein